MTDRRYTLRPIFELKPIIYRGDDAKINAVPRKTIIRPSSVEEYVEESIEDEIINVCVDVSKSELLSQLEDIIDVDAVRKTPSLPPKLVASTNAKQAVRPSKYAVATTNAVVTCPSTQVYNARLNKCVDKFNPLNPPQRQ